MSVSLPVDGPGDAELISAVRGGDVDAYGELFARHVDSARRLARQLAGHADADDLVSDAFTKVLTVLQRGGGPDLAFRAYLLTAVRRLHVDKIRSGSRLRPVDDLTPFDPGLPFQDTAVEGFENAAAAKAFASLPERWQMVLWHTEVEQQKPADIAPLLGMSANSVSALAYRAREGLRQAFLSQHATDPDDVDCAWTRDHLGAYIRSGLSRRDAARVDDHLASCRACAAVYLELTEVNSGLAGILAPLLLGSAGTAYVSSGSGGSGLLSTSFSAAKTWAAAHASLTAIGGMLVTATAVASIYGAAHLHTRDAADLGSPPAPHHGTAATGGPGQGGHHQGNRGPGGSSKGPGSGDSSAPTGGPTSGVPGSTDSSSAPDEATSAPTEPGGTSDGPSDGGTDSTGPSGGTSGGPTDPTSGPTDPTSGPTGPSGGGSVAFTSTPPANPKFGDTYRPRASGGSGNQIVFSVDQATTNNACSINGAGTTVTFDHAGKCVLQAHEDSRQRSGNGATRGSHDAVQKIHVAKEDQRITLSSAPDDAAVSGPSYHVTAEGGGSGNDVVISTGTSGVCTVSGARVSFDHVGDCTVTADQAGNNDYHPASTRAQTFTVHQGTPTVSFGQAPTAPAFGDTYSLEVSSDSGGTVAVSVSSQTTDSACSLNDVTSVVTFHHAGACVIEAHVAETADFTADTVTQTVSVPQAAQQVTFTSKAPTNPAFGDSYTVTATSDSGGPIDFFVDSTITSDACTVSDGDPTDTSATVTFRHAGPCAIDATQAGTSDYTSATTAQPQETKVPKAEQAVDFTVSQGDRVVDGTATLTATSTGDSGNQVTFKTSTPDVCTVSGTTVSFQHATSCSIEADQAGNGDYDAATPVTHAVDVGRGTPDITFTTTPPADPVVGTTPYPVAATSSTGETVTFRVDGDGTACALSGDDTVVIHHVGTCVVTAHTHGDADYLPATSTQQFTVGQGTATITFTTPPANAVVGGTPYALVATSDSGETVFLSADATKTTNSACEITHPDNGAATVLFHHAGTCAVTAHTNGDADYLPATSTQQLAVGQGSQAITFTSTPPASPSFKDTYVLSATGGRSGNPVTFTSTTTGVCALSGSTVTFLHAGSCVVNADQSGSDDYVAAPQAAQTIAVPKAAQQVSFTSTPPSPALVGGKGYAVSATGGASGNPVTFSSGSSKVCTVAGSTVTFVSPGACVVNADQSGSNDYAAATTASQTFQVTAQNDLTLSATTDHGWLFGVFGTVVHVRVTGLDPGAHATLSMSSDGSAVWSPQECSTTTSGVTTCPVTSTPTTLSFLGFALVPQASLTFTVSSPDSQDSDPSDNTITVPIRNLD
ncbi:MAG TPA: sigma-70 family RNA polymerase sigma factor [Nocardioides sp.]|uniref:sigma-70 family RNA polymerase sigma factor n=1 Tax=Nocardioides sp. TaxID=35761 RepID=UPI002E3100CB|nr:sigma-70 family RNA polymerase sigma factor [Nocardioides sp.]HEX3931853.1 sigma-70 family RNA polymerase sigma factor [Nocardioides sp.]